MDISRRVRSLNDMRFGDGFVIYWMSRDQRVDDNYALFWAQKRALEWGLPLVVVVTLVDQFLCANNRVFQFMNSGLKIVASKFDVLNIPFFIFQGNPVDVFEEIASKNQIALIVGDFSPLKIGRHWREQIANAISVKFEEVDAHNLIPVWELSDKQEFGAHTIRHKIVSKIDDWYAEVPTVVNQTADRKCLLNIQGMKAKSANELSVLGNYIDGCDVLNDFLTNKLHNYIFNKNNPNIDGQSGLSSYMHFGQISAFGIVNAILKKGFLNLGRLKEVWLDARSHRVKIPADSVGVFLEELIVRRELAENFCYYNSSYDFFDGLPDWGKRTLNDHRFDQREYLYSLDQWESASTHDQLWNACQSEMMTNGRMHGYMRMYWAKKILEWSSSPEEAIKTAIYLNDKYELDGRDPNGYAGIAWAIGGLHDRPWSERKVFGMVRYMNEAGCRRKFDVDKYVNRWRNV